MLNTQPRMDVMTSGIAIHSIWYTIQGEGPHIGTPAIFVRLYGCNLQCPLCDTDYTSRGGLTFHASAEAAADYIVGQSNCLMLTHQTHLRNKPLIVFTGGEPFRQHQFPELCSLLMNYGAGGFQVQVETNGSLYPSGVEWSLLNMPECSIVISPKRQVDAKWFDESLRDRSFKVYYKYLIQRGHIDPIDGLPTGVLGYQVKVHRPPLFAIKQNRVMVQPVDVHDPADNKLNEQECVNVAMQFGYRYTPQLHKALNLP